MLFQRKLISELERLPDIRNSLHQNVANISDVHKMATVVLYYVDEKPLTVSLFNNSEKLVQILLEFSQQIVKGYEFVLAIFAEKDAFS